MPYPKSRMLSRVTLQFRSDHGRQYLYDDVTGSIFPWSDAREAVLSGHLAGCLEEERRELSERYGEAEIAAAARLVERWRSHYGAFAREESAEQPLPPPDQLEKYIRATSYELLLILTENCNLRCRYCALSDLYPLNRSRTSRRMTFAIARRAIDWYVSLVQQQRERNPRKQFGLSFYGGEPMMNMPLLGQVLAYVRDKYPGWFLPVMTTNGTLLTAQRAQVLVEHGVMLSISIDGPAREHDRLRVDRRGKGTFGRIAANLEWLRKHYPDYWDTKVTAVSVYDWATDLEAVERFFQDNAHVLPRSIFVNQVSPRNTDWYGQYDEDEWRRMRRAMMRLRERYKQSKIEGGDTSGYLSCLVGIPIVFTHIRRRFLDVRPDSVPFSGSCVPGQKIAVHVDGHLDVCERVNGRYPIGHLDKGGLDYPRICALIAQYRRQALGRCADCPVTKCCDLCFSLVESEEGFADTVDLCPGVVAGTRQRLVDYVSILEANPNADFHFDTDTSRLEERLLLGC